MMKFKVEDPTNNGSWDSLLTDFSRSGFFHSSTWCRTLVEAYGYRPLYLIGFDSHQISALVPLMGINSWLTGRRGVSLPFSDNCPPLVKKKEDWPEIWQELIKMGRNNRWRYLEIRGDDSELYKDKLNAGFINHVVDLKTGPGEQFFRLRESTRRNIRKAIKNNVTVKNQRSYESLMEYYRLHVLTRKRHGLPPQPKRFFQAIYRNILETGYGRLFLAYPCSPNGGLGRSIAGAIFFTFRDKAIFKFGASEPDVRRIRPNDMVLWSAIRALQSDGFKSLDLGRSDPENCGLIHFKDGWDSRQKKCFYWNYDLEKDVFTAPKWKVSGYYNKLFSKLPSGALRALGSGIYRHIG